MLHIKAGSKVKLHQSFSIIFLIALSLGELMGPHIHSNKAESSFQQNVYLFFVVFFFFCILVWSTRGPLHCH